MSRPVVQLCLAAFLLPALWTATAAAVEPRISASLGHAIAVDRKGNVYAWGNDQYGQLGIGRFLGSNLPLTMAGVNGIEQLAAGSASNYAVLADGSVRAWGNNTSGQLGDGSTTARSTPVKVASLDRVAAVSASQAGFSYALALRSDGSVWSWGANDAGQLGAGNGADRHQAAPIAGLIGIASVSAGHWHGLALDRKGSVLGWGNGDYGQLGEGIAASPSLPATIGGLPTAAAVAAGATHSLVLDENGEVWSFGTNLFGERGDIGGGVRATPAKVAGLPRIKAVTAAAYDSYALAEDGRVFAWGLNYYGQLGNADVSFGAQPMEVKGLPEIAALRAGGEYFCHVVALAKDGRLFSWGAGTEGQIGNGHSDNVYVPTQVSGLSNARLIAAGDEHSAAVDADGTLWVWGRNNHGQLGRYDAMWQTVPHRIALPRPATAATATSFASFALTDDGQLWGWGDGTYLFGSAAAESSTPEAIPEATGLSAIAGGGLGLAHMLALRDGKVLAWGWNEKGELGDGSTDPREIPKEVRGLADMVSVAAGGLIYGYSLALDGSGQVWAWGDNGMGQLGDGSTESRANPARIRGLSDIAVLAAGARHNLALDHSGQVWAWGANDTGQLGTGDLLNRLRPEKVASLSGIVAIAAGLDGTSLAVDGQGHVWRWGNAMTLADAGPRQTTCLMWEYSNVPCTLHPQSMAEPYDAIAVAGGVYTTFAIKRDGLVWSQGLSNWGQIGDGAIALREAPVLAVDPAWRDFLDLDPDTPNQVPAGKEPPFFTRVKPEAASIAAQLGIRPEHLGKPGNIYLFMKVPLEQLANGFSVGEEWFANNGAGWEPLAGGAMPAYYSGTLDAAAGNVTLIENAAPETLPPGTQIYAGYGQSTEEMVDAGRAVNVLTGGQPEAQPPSGGGQFGATAATSGTPEAFNLAANLDIAAADEGRPGNIYLAALFAGNFYFHDGAAWQAWAGGPLPILKNGPLQDQTIPILAGTDIHPFGGARFFVGYGQTEADMLDNQRYREIYEIP